MLTRLSGNKEWRVTARVMIVRKNAMPKNIKER